ncbi:hypothetical protein DXA95_04635 [Odoribacter sp. OF09-27XD]|jgi:hypothetical protein|nr:hypothetical protein [Odoribacter sp. OF09-27XD]RHV96962.1 hypothetical protein DXA95_04635 [Odoribacter sp. OF09-27XD]
MKTGIYKLNKDIVDINFKELANCGEVINITSVSCDKSYYGNRYELQIEFERFGKSETQEVIFFKENKLECNHLFERMFTPLELIK